jgi:hypothetical protein
MNASGLAIASILMLISLASIAGNIQQAAPKIDITLSQASAICADVEQY